MSGYLQRLARSVMQPVETVHPLVGSVFSAPESRSEPDAPSWNTASAEQPELQKPQRQEQEAQDEKSRPAPLIAQNEVASPSQPVPGRNSNSAATSLPPPSNATQPQASRTTERTQAGETPPAQEIEVPRESPYTPLIAVSPLRSDRRARPEVASSFVAPNAQRKPKADAVPRAEREPDEIQIHIGRIEVSAVPQAPPATAVRVSRKASSLDEYLRRRDGRTS